MASRSCLWIWIEKHLQRERIRSVTRSMEIIIQYGKHFQIENFVNFLFPFWWIDFFQTQTVVLKDIFMDRELRYNISFREIFPVMVYGNTFHFDKVLPNVTTDIIFLYTLDRLFAYRFPAKESSVKKPTQQPCCFQLKSRLSSHVVFYF